MSATKRGWYADLANQSQLNLNTNPGFAVLGTVYMLSFKYFDRIVDRAIVTPVKLLIQSKTQYKISNNKHVLIYIWLSLIALDRSEECESLVLFLRHRVSHISLLCVHAS